MSSHQLILYHIKGIYLFISFSKENLQLKIIHPKNTKKKFWPLELNLEMVFDL